MNDKPPSWYKLIVGLVGFGGTASLSGRHALFSDQCDCCRAISATAAFFATIMFVAGVVLTYEKLTRKVEPEK